MPSQKPTVPRMVDEVPAKTSGGKWVDILMPLTKKKGRYFLVADLATPEKAQDTQANLHQRKVMIPYSDHEWWFGARGTELYAKYLGPTRKKR